MSDMLVNDKKKFLVSFCNNKEKICTLNKTGVIAVVTIYGNNKTRIEEISLNGVDLEKVNGATGIAKSENFYYILLQSSTPKLVILSKIGLLVKNTIELPQLKGVHSIVFLEKSFYIADTRHDRVVKYNLDGTYKEVFEIGSMRDTHHINSLCMHNGELYCSAFGNNDNEFWMHASDGYVLNLETKELLLSGLKQPHSLFSYSGKLYVCDSSRKRVIDENKTIIAENPSGYVRGLHIQEDLLVMGISKGREKSYTNNKFIGNISDEGILSGNCEIRFLRKEKYITVPLSDLADEIYDIVAMT